MPAGVASQPDGTDAAGLSVMRSIPSAPWLVAALIVAAAFPGLIYWASGLFGFQSPSNFVFLCGVGILLVRLFSQDCKISALQRKLIRFAQNEALGEADRGSRSHRRPSRRRQSPMPSLVALVVLGSSR